MKTVYRWLGWLAAIAGIAGLFACQPAQDNKEGTSQVSPTPPRFPVPSPTTSAPRKEETTAPVVRLDTPQSPMMPLRGTIKAYEIKDVSQLGPGLLADGFLGDLVLENDLVRAVVRRPDPKLPAMPPAGALIDISNQKSRADYLNYYEPLPDIESTTTRIKFERVARFLVDNQTTAQLVLTGHVEEVIPARNQGDEGEESTATQTKVLPIRVTHTFELAKNVPYLIIRTQFTNESTAPVALFPGDYIDWGEASAFVEGYGVANGTTTKANWVGASRDDFSAGVCVPGPKPLTNISAGRYTVVQAFDTPKKVIPSIPTPSATIAKPGTAGGFVQQPLTPSLAVPTETHRPLPVATPPRPETGFTPPRVGVPSVTPPSRPETHYGPRASNDTEGNSSLQAHLAFEQSVTSDEFVEVPGGGVKDSQPATTETLAVASSQPSANTAATPPQKPLVLAPRKSYEFVRYLVIGDRDLSRVSEEVYRLKQIPMGTIAGVVVEDGSARPLAAAEVRLSGGPSWNGKGVPYAFTRTLTRADGTFVARVPYGNYALTAAKVGHEMISQPQRISLFRNSPTQYAGIVLSKESRLEVAVSDPEAATSAPLPSRLTLIAKPGTEPVDWGYGPGSVAGVRNIAYMPYGAASLPVSPGYYRLLISRGPEYEAIQQDVVVTRGSTQKIVVTLPRAFTTPGMVSTDLGVLTTASATSLITPEDVAVMAACEGVSIIVTGDFNQATDLTPAIRRLGLQKRVKCIPGMRLLCSARGSTANVLVYPVTNELASKLTAFMAKHRQMPPDVVLADLRKEFPDLVIQIDQPLHPLYGYLAPIPFDDRFKRYDDLNVPPPDFHAMQVLNGKIVAEFQDAMDRYFDLEIKRTRATESAPALTPVGSSMCRLPYGTEVGYPRVYTITIHDTLDTFTPTDLAQAIMNQRVVVTNSLMPKILGYAPAARTYAANPGDIVDTGTTGALPMKINILAASWVSLSNFDLTWNGKMVRRVQVMPVKKVLRYPVRQQKDADIQHVYVDGDGFANLICFSNRQPLSPIVPPPPPDFGTDLWPLAWTGPIFVDQDRNGKIRIENDTDRSANPSMGLPNSDILRGR